jgi:MerR family transcriptional regulator, heat shock protein HspR
MKVEIAGKDGRVLADAVKIGAVARKFNISVDLLRLYEREGLVIPLKSRLGTRFYTEADYPWIATILRLVREAHLNFAGIRRLLALLPCWEFRQCGFNHKDGCPVILNSIDPCWTNRGCCKSLSTKDCYYCEVYRAAPRCENLKALIARPEHVPAQANA